VEWSKKIIQAFDRPENAKKGVITVEGKMVERLHLVQAKRTVGIANAVHQIEEWF
jgi:citrate lyase subunit beta/citryl-CoA lyase